MKITESIECGVYVNSQKTLINRYTTNYYDQQFIEKYKTGGIDSNLIYLNKLW